MPRIAVVQSYPELASRFAREAGLSRSRDWRAVIGCPLHLARAEYSTASLSEVLFHRPTCGPTLSVGTRSAASESARKRSCRP